MNDDMAKQIAKWLEQSERRRCILESFHGSMESIQYYRGEVEAFSSVLEKFAGWDRKDILRLKLRAGGEIK